MRRRGYRIMGTDILFPATLSFRPRAAQPAADARPARFCMVPPTGFEPVPPP
jgi:hypothetical protein